jgi:hypothetical protein
MNDASDKPQSQPGLPAPYVSPRRDGWTAARQDAFLKALAACGCVTHACRAVGMSRESAYALYQRPAAAAFRAGWDAALDCSIRLVEDGAWSRAIQGVPRPVFHQGEQVGEYRHYDERLSMFLLRFRRPHRYRDLPVPPVIHPPGWEEDGPNPDAAIEELDWQLGDLVGEAELPGAAGETSRAIDGVNFVNFQAEPPSTAEGLRSDRCPNRHPGLEPGPAFTSAAEEETQDSSRGDAEAQRS